MAVLLVFAALLLGIITGIVLNWSRFCGWLAFHDWQNSNDSRRLLALMLILGLSVAGTQIVALFAGVDMTSSLLLVPAFSWTGSMLGGAAFGIGMVLAKGDPLRHLQKFASGQVSSLPILFWSVLSFALLSTGLLSVIRELTSQATWIDLRGSGTRSQGLADLIGTSGVSPEYVAASAAGAFFIFMALPPFFNGRLRKTGRLFFGAMLLGIVTPLLWWLSSPGASGVAGSELAHAINPVADISMMLGALGGGRPMDSLACFMLGLVLGCLTHALITGNFGKNLKRTEPHGMRGFIGALSMGIGGAFAGGGLWGAGIGGVSVLALGSIATFIAIAIGATIGARMIDGEVEETKAAPAPGSKEASQELARRVAEMRKRDEKPQEVEVEIETESPAPRRRRRRPSRPDAEPKGMTSDE